MVTYLDELVQKITTKADLKGFDDLDRKQKRAVTQNNLLARSFRNAFGIFLSIQGMRSIVETSRKFDLMQKSLKGLTKSADDFKYLRSEAYRTGTDLLTIAGAYKNFYSAATGVGFKKGAVQGMFSDVLTAGRGIGASQQQIGSALLALEQMLSKGKVSMEELRRQMGNALPGAFEIAARSMGKTTAEFNKMLEAGLSSAEFVPKFTAQLKKELGSGFNESIKSLDFALVNLSTAWQEFQANLLQGEAGEALTDLVKQITKILRSQSLLNFIKLISQAIGLVIKNLKWILIIFGVTKIVQYTQAIIRLHYAILATAESTAALGAVTRTLAMGYSMLTSGQIINGLAMLRAGLLSMIAPTLILSAKIAAIVAAILLVQDLLLTFADPTADTYTRDLINGMNELERRGAKIQRQALINQYEATEGKGNVKVSPNGGIYETAPGMITGGAANIGYLGDLPSLTPNNQYSSSYSERRNNQQNNTISINIYPQQGQSEQDIGEAVATKLGEILDNYVMVS